VNLLDPSLELHLYHLRQDELAKAATRERLLRSSPRSSNALVRWLFLSLGELLIGLGERLREEFEEPAQGVAV